ncbi:MAG: hypothetical protein ACLQKA_15550 [Bryobacteraceae bacterium]
MRILCGLAIAILVSGTLSAQHHGGSSSGHSGAAWSGSRWNGSHSSTRFSNAAGVATVPFVYPVVDPDIAPPASEAYADSYQPAPDTTGVSDSYGSQYSAAAEPPPHGVIIDMEDLDAAAAPEQAHYYIALKDHHIYLAVAYWVEGATLHYFLPGNTHNQVSLSLVDYALTKRLNRESGIEVRLPTAK